jgi:hypothetical protein
MNGYFLFFRCQDMRLGKADALLPEENEKLEAHMKSRTYTGELCLPNFKQGDDLAECQRAAGDNAQALRKYALQLKEAADLCEELAAICKKHRLVIEGDTHTISVTGPWKVMHELIDSGMIDPGPEDEDDDDVGEAGDGDEPHQATDSGQEDQARAVDEAADPQGAASTVWRPLGKVTIDTARLLLIDPCNFVDSADQAIIPNGEMAVQQIAIPGGDLSAVVVETGLGDGRYRVEGRYAESPFGRRLAEIRVRFMDEDGDWLGGDE